MIAFSRHAHVGKNYILGFYLHAQKLMMKGASTPKTPVNF
jgi:hypothetical protein